MSLLNDVKLKIGGKFAELAAKDFAVKAEKGELGNAVQACYVKTKGYKSFFALALFLIVQALGQFTPPNYDCYIRYAGIFSGALIALGLLDKLRRKEPIFEPWFLETMATWTAWFTAASAAVLGIAQGGLLGILFPKYPGLADRVTVIVTAIGTATAFINRAAKASATQPRE
jgi:hypothetical protein